MWAIIKIDKKNLSYLKYSFKNKLGDDLKIYSPKFLIQKFHKNKLKTKEIELLGEYIFCFHKKFENPTIISSLKYTKGLKYFLNGFLQSQEDIKKFISRCKESENDKGYLTQNFFEIYEKHQYKFSSGPFVDKIFSIVSYQKNKLNILLGNIRTTLKRKDNLIFPL